MIKRWKVKAEIYWSANREETVIVKANTQRKAVQFAIKKIKEKHPDVGDMINIREVKEV